MTQAMTGRLIAAVGVVLGIVALWTSALPGGGKYWDDGTLGGALLILMILTGLLLAWAYTTGRKDLDTAAAALGTIACGIYLFVPILLAFNHLTDLNTGAWLGVCTVLIPIGCWLTADRRTTIVATNRTTGLAACTLGMVLVLVGIWTHATTGSTYWSYSGQGHNIGITLLVLTILTAVTLLAAMNGTTWATDAALLWSTLTFGLTMFVLTGAAFNDLGQVKIGGWLAAIGGISLVAGVMTLRGTLMARTAPRPATAM